MNILFCSKTNLPGVRFLAAVAVAVAMAFTAAVRANATNMTITPTFDSSITSDPDFSAIEGAINSAISFYDTTFTNPIDVDITFQEMSTGLGESSSFFGNVSYSSYVGAMIAESTDAEALANLPANGGNNPVTGDSGINVKAADQAALGLTTSPVIGGTVSLNTGITDGGGCTTLNDGCFSLETVAEHEIDEVLGLGSALGSTFGNTTLGPPFNGDPFPEDLYRYQCGSPGTRSFTTTDSRTSGVTACLSINGSTDVPNAQFDNQNDGGDFGDWQSNSLPTGVNPQVQDAFATPLPSAPLLSLSSNEVAALEAIGYDVAPTPEPSSLFIFAAGLLVLGWWARRRMAGISV